MEDEWRDHPDSEEERWRILMAAIDDLNTAVTALQAEQVAVATAVTDLVAAVQASSAANDPAIEAAVTNIQAVTTGLATSAAADPGPQPAPVTP